MGRISLMLIAGLMLSSSAMAQSKNSNNAPIEVSADSFLADMNSKSGTYSGNVVVKKGDINLRANSIRVNLVNGKPDRIVATGNVVATSPSAGTVNGNEGVYVVATNVITLTGKVLWKKDKNSMSGNTLTVNLVTGNVGLNARGPATSGEGGQGSGGRVHSTFTPPPQSKPGTNP